MFVADQSFVQRVSLEALSFNGYCYTSQDYCAFLQRCMLHAVAYRDGVTDQAVSRSSVENILYTKQVSREARKIDFQRLYCLLSLYTLML
jgi:hypothetical protein